MKALIFDLDGTLVDSVHAHVLAWQRAMAEFALSVDAAAIHQRIGMSGNLLMKECIREREREAVADDMAAMDALHSKIFQQLAPDPRPLNGANELLRCLDTMGIPFGIATSAKRQDIASSLANLALRADVVIVDGSATPNAKPEPDLFRECQRRLGVAATDCLVVGDAVWDILAARRAGILAVGLLCGGSNADDLYRAGAFRVYHGPGELSLSLEELGFS